MTNLAALLTESATRHPDQTAIKLDELEISYRQLDEWTERRIWARLHRLCRQQLGRDGGVSSLGNEISDDGVRLLVNSPLWPRLERLVLGGNPISDEGARTLADAAGTSRLEYLNLKFTGITSEAHRVLLRKFPRRTKLDLF